VIDSKGVPKGETGGTQPLEFKGVSGRLRKATQELYCENV